MEDACHSTENLYNSRYGFVYQCRHCEYLQIEFGNLIIGYSLENFQLFSELINTIDLDDENIYHGHLSRKIIIQPVSSMGYYCFSRDEVMDLRDLLNGAVAMLELNDCLNRNSVRRTE